MNSYTTEVIHENSIQSAEFTCNSNFALSSGKFTQIVNCMLTEIDKKRVEQWEKAKDCGKFICVFETYIMFTILDIDRLSFKKVF